MVKVTHNPYDDTYEVKERRVQMCDMRSAWGRRGAVRCVYVCV